MPRKKALRFSVPYNNDFSLLESLAQLRSLNGNSIEEIYLAAPQEYMGSGRTTGRSTEKDLVKVLKFCRERGLQANLLLNAQCPGLDKYEPEKTARLVDFIAGMHERWGLNALTIGDPFFIRLIKKEVGAVKITASVHSCIDSTQKALFFEQAGASALAVDEDITRDLAALRRIKRAVSCELKLMVNDYCLYKCPMKISHGNWISHASEEPEKALRDYGRKNVFRTVCSQMRRRDPSQILKSPWIRPEDLRKYGAVTGFFKLAGRMESAGFILNAVRAYMSEAYDGDLLDLIDGAGQLGLRIDNRRLGGFFEKVTACDKDCPRCGYCERLVAKVVQNR